MEWFVRKILVDNYLEHYEESLRNIPLSHMLNPLEKTIQYPAHAMHLNASVNDDNISIVKNLEWQIGTSPEWYQSFVQLCHGDLGTQERHEAMTESCAIESTPQEQLQFLVTIPGCFHIHMACMDAIWQVHIQSNALHEVKGGVFDQFKVLHPKDWSKLASNPTYHMLNDGIQHLISSHLLVCWEQATGFSNLKDFAESEPLWSDVVCLSEMICCKKIAGWVDEEEQQNEDDPRDHLEDGNLLFQHNGLWYCMLAHAMNTGAVGVMEDLLWLWVPMFSGCDKHKYAAHLATG